MLFVMVLIGQCWTTTALLVDCLVQCNASNGFATWAFSDDWNWQQKTSLIFHI